MELSTLHDESTKLVQEEANHPGDAWWKPSKDRLFARMIYASYFASSCATEPYYSIYYRQKGFSPSQIGLFFGIRPVLGFIASPLWGMLGDRFRIRRILFFVVWLGWLTTIALLCSYPYPDRASACPDGIQCNVTDSGNATLESAQHVTCSTEDLSDDQLDDLTNNLSWIYDESSLFVVLAAMGFLVLASEVFLAPVGAFADAMSLKVVGSPSKSSHSPPGTYGSLRAAGSAGWAIGAFLTGLFINQSRYLEVICGIELYFADYRVIIYIFLALSFIALAFSTQVKFDTENLQEKSEDRVHRAYEVLKVYANLHYASILTTTFFSALAKGLEWAFLFWYLQTMGADQFLMGLYNTVEGLSEVIGFSLYEKYVVSRIGYTRTFGLSVFVYSMVCIGFGFIENPWLAVVLAFPYALSFSGLWISLVKAVTEPVPEDYYATALGVAHGIHYGLGLGVGKLIAGFLVDAVGAQWTFRVVGSFDLLAFLIFVIVQKLSSKPTENQFGKIENLS